MRRMTRHTLRNISSLNASGVALVNGTAGMTGTDARANVQVVRDAPARRTLLQSGDSLVAPPPHIATSSATRLALMQSTELLSPAETFLQPFEPVLTQPGALASAPAVGVFPPRAFAWRHLDDLADAAAPPAASGPSVFESARGALKMSSMSVHDVEIPEDIQDVRPAPLIRSPRAVEPDDAGFWSSK
jgi:hypothetical protein